MEDRKNSTPEILSAKDLQNMGFSRSMSYALFNREDIPVIRIGKRKFRDLRALCRSASTPRSQIQGQCCS